MAILQQSQRAAAAAIGGDHLDGGEADRLEKNIRLSFAMFVLVGISLGWLMFPL
jgi:hypothetical protein